MNPVAILDITDPGKDLDDELKFILWAGLQSLGLVKLIGVVANLEPPLERAKLALGTLREIGLPLVPVGVGTDCFKGGENPRSETDADYANDIRPDELHDGLNLSIHLLANAPDKVTICCNSGLTDMARLIATNPELIQEKVQEIVIMGGVQATANQLQTVQGPDGLAYLVPDDAANNAFDWPASLYVYQWAQEHRVPLVILMRPAVYACQFPIALFDRLAATGNRVGINLLNRQKPSMNHLWRAVNSDRDSPTRGKLPITRDRKWFVDIFCNGIDPGIRPDDEIWSHVRGFNQYDPVAAVAAVPSLRHHYFASSEHVVKGVTHQVIGQHKDRTGVLDADALCQFIADLQIRVLTKQSGREP